MDLRCFIALELPDRLKEAVGSMLGELKKSDADVRWVPPENLHLTLKFLGNVPEETVPAILRQVESAAARRRSFKAVLNGVGVFPGRKRPRVVWIGLDGADELVALQGDVDRNLSSLGFEPEGRAFSPHLTIGRARSQRGMMALMTRLDSLAGTLFGEFMVESISIMRSKLSPAGAQYTRLHGVPLGGR